MIFFFDLKAQYQQIKSEIDAAIASVLKGGQFIGGPFVEKFEADFLQAHPATYCIGVGNGTDAILIALKALGAGSGDEVIVPAFGQISASEMITLAGAKPVFVDVLPSGVIDPSKIAGAITSATKGVVVVHLYGQAAPVMEIKRIADMNRMFVIEDCAQAHLTRENQMMVGTIGDVGTFSFYPTKNLGAFGDAGAVITREERLATKMRLLANHGGLQHHHFEGMNSRLDPMQAAILSVKLRYLKAWTERRRKHTDRYFLELRGVSELVLPELRPDTAHSFHQFVIRTKQRDALKNFLETKGIQTLIHYPVALHNLPAYQHQRHLPEDFPEATRCQHEVLSLPVYPELSEEQIIFICESIKLFFGTKA